MSLPTTRTTPARAARARAGARLPTLAGLAACLLLVGCGRPDGPEMVRVSGTVTYQGKPLPRGTITFLPEGEGQPASGTIGRDGTYTLQTVEPGDGARTGRYKVIVTTSDVDIEALDTAMLPGEMPKGNKLTPEKYERADSSGLTAEIRSDTHTLDFNLE